MLFAEFTSFHSARKSPVQYMINFGEVEVAGTVLTVVQKDGQRETF